MAKPISSVRREEVVQAYLSRKALDPGTSYEAVAAEFGVSRASLNRWLQRLRGEGTVERVVRRRNGPLRLLSGAQSEALARWAVANPTLRLWELRAYMEQEHQVKVSEGTLRRELNRHGIGKRRLTKLTRAAASPAEAVEERRYKAKHRRKVPPKPHRNSYPSDFTDAEWSAVEPLWREHARSFPEKHSLRDVVEALRYLGATGCPWQYLPNDFPPQTTVRHWFDAWHRDGTISRVNDALRRLLRRRAGREETPSVLIIDSLSVKTREGGEARGYDGGKKVSGRKRHIAVDTMGFPWLIAIHGAGVQDRDGIDLVVPHDIRERLPRLQRILADAGYQGRAEHRTLARTGIPLEIVRRRGDATTGEWGEKTRPPDALVSGFQVLPKRWIVERSHAWANRRRRLSGDNERTVGAAESWLELAFQHIMTARMVP